MRIPTPRSRHLALALALLVGAGGVTPATVVAQDPSTSPGAPPSGPPRVIPEPPSFAIPDPAEWPDAAARTTRDVAVPGDPADSLTWWSIDPATGATRAVLSPALGGYHHYVNGVLNQGERIAVKGISDPIATRAELNSLAREAAASLEQSRPPSTGCSIRGNEYSMLLCIAIIAAAGIAIIGLMVGIKALIATVFFSSATRLVAGTARPG